MSIANGLVKGRSHIVFMLGLITAGSIIISLERSSLLQPVPARVLTIAEKEAAALAWQAAAGTPDAARIAEHIGVDTHAPRPHGLRSMSPAAGRAILLALDRRASSDTDAIIP